MKRRSFLKQYVIAVVIMFFVAVNFYLIGNLLLITGDSRTDAEETVVDGFDYVSISRLEGSHSVVDDLVIFNGELEAVNAQSVPAAGAVVTVQFVGNGGPQIEQAVTNKEGIATFAFTFKGIGSYRIEGLDISGENYRYDTTRNAITIYQSRVTTDDYPKTE